MDFARSLALTAPEILLSVSGLVLLLVAAVPVFWPGPDYGLLVLIAEIWFGTTVESALKARRA